NSSASRWRCGWGRRPATRCASRASRRSRSSFPAASPRIRPWGGSWPTPSPRCWRRAPASSTSWIYRPPSESIATGGEREVLEARLLRGLHHLHHAAVVGALIRLDHQGPRLGALVQASEPIGEDVVRRLLALEDHPA